MKIENIKKINANKIQPKKVEEESSISFKELMSGRRDEMDVERLNKLIEDIEDQGKVLAQSLTVEDLRDYKNKVKEFIDEAVKHGLKIQQSRGFNRGGRIRMYKIIKKVDEKLLELADAVISKEQKGLKVLDLVGEIRGLLLDLYA
ncbi:MAG: YaaR family protein [Firmicutes bacterium]|nr:YaaR family protein [Bacillota bacterium]